MKMKNISTLLVKGMVLVSFIYAGTVSPTLSMRFNDLLGGENAMPTPKTILGLEASVGEGVSAGIDSDGDEHRLYVKFGYGTFGMGANSDGDPQFTIGGNYDVTSQFSVNLDYVINQMAVVTPAADQLRVSLKVNF